MYWEMVQEEYTAPPVQADPHAVGEWVGEDEEVPADELSLAGFNVQVVGGGESG